MKVSLNWAQEVSNVDLKSLSKDDLLKKIGEQLGAVEDVIEWGPKYEGIVVAKVVTSEQHPNADKLHVCRIDDGGVVGGIERGEDNLVQVVCGAPNVKAGMLVAWLPPGSTVPSTREKDPFVLEARELRGIVSNGMLASAAELGINDDHDGILEIVASEVGTENTAPGTPFKNLYGLDDIVIDCENKMFTHRPDCFGILGVARELAGITHQQFKSPPWYVNTPQFKTANDLPLEIKVDTKLVPRFMAVALDNITVGKSPIAMQSALTRVGIRPINAVVDITNWLMHLTGQPLHAYDYDKIKSLCNATPVLVARMGHKDDTVQLLNGKKVTPDEQTIVIATDKNVVAIGGVMGGEDTEVDETTKRIIVEVASFDMYSIRKAAMKYGLFTDAVTRFTKGQSTLQNDRVIAEAIRLIHELCSATQASPVHDIKDARVKAMSEVRTNVEFINGRLGTHLTKDVAEQLLANVECAEALSSTSETRSYLMGVGNIDDKITRIGVKIVEKTSKGHYKLIIPSGTENDYEKLVSWEMKPGYWCEYVGASNVFMFKDQDTKVTRYELSNDTEHEIVEMCRTFANDYYTSLEAILQGNPWYVPLLPLRKSYVRDIGESNDIRVSPPFWRTDISIPEDLVEEVGRLYGYGNIEAKLPLRVSSPTHKNATIEFSNKARTILAKAGANELLTYSFVHGNLLQKVGQDEKLAYHIRNALSPDLQFYRLSLTPSLLDKVNMNSRAGYEEFALYEIGKTHNKVEKTEANKVPKEHSMLALVTASSSKVKSQGSPYYKAKQYLEFLAAELGITLSYQPITSMPDYPVLKPFETNRSALVSVKNTNILLGIIGEYTNQVDASLKLPLQSAGFEIGLKELHEAYAARGSRYTQLARFPKSQQDITLEVHSKVSFGQLKTGIEETLALHSKEHGYVCTLEDGTIFVPENSEKRRITFRIVLSHPHRTLTTEEVNKILDEVSRHAVTTFAVVRI